MLLDEVYYTVRYLSDISATDYVRLARQFELAGAIVIDQATQYPCVPESYLLRIKSFREALGRQILQPQQRALDVPKLGNEHTCTFKALQHMLPLFADMFHERGITQDPQGETLRTPAHLELALTLGKYRRVRNNNSPRYVAKDFVLPLTWMSPAEKSFLELYKVLDYFCGKRRMDLGNLAHELQTAHPEMEEEDADALAKKTLESHRPIAVQGESQEEFTSPGLLPRRPGRPRTKPLPGAPSLKTPLHIAEVCFDLEESFINVSSKVPRFSFDVWSPRGKVPTTREGLQDWIPTDLAIAVHQLVGDWVTVLREDRLALKRAKGIWAQSHFEEEYQRAKTAVYKDRRALESGVFARFMGPQQELQF